MIYGHEIFVEQGAFHNLNFLYRKNFVKDTLCSELKIFKAN